jgi:hypothetical protein
VISSRRPPQVPTHYFEYCEEVGCEVWDQLSAVEAALQEPMGLWLPEALRPADSSTYVQGVESGAAAPHPHLTLSRRQALSGPQMS